MYLEKIKITSLAFKPFAHLLYRDDDISFFAFSTTANVFPLPGHAHSTVFLVALT